MIPAIRSQFEALREEPKRWLYIALALFFLYWVLRGCLPGNTMPAEVAEKIERNRIECITTEETAIHPGETRQPECGRMIVEMVKNGTVPASAQADGVTQAICYRITIENPRWETMGKTRHELIWAGRSYSKVAILKEGDWQIFPDEYLQDEQRWLDYGCPGEYVTE
jgi:hypothetical protein